MVAKLIRPSKPFPPGRCLATENLNNIILDDELAGNQHDETRQQNSDILTVRHPGSKSLWSCPICKMTFTNTRNFESHAKSKHKQSIIYQCRLCDVTANVSRSIGTHMRYCEGCIKPKSFRCNLCDFSSDFENGLKVHISIQHI